VVQAARASFKSGEREMAEEQTKSMDITNRQWKNGLTKEADEEKE
jgi:hypothetical protein